MAVEGREKAKAAARPATWAEVVVDDNAMLPAVCPACLAPAARRLPVPGPKQDTRSSLEAHYCDLCADAIENTTTRSVAISLALALVAITIATTAALLLDTSGRGLQLLVTATIPALLAAALVGFGVWQRESFALRELRRSTTGDRRLVCQRADYARLLGTTIEAPPPAPSTRPPLWLLVLAPGVGVLWSIGLHQFGSTEVRILHSSEESAILLVDGRKRLSIPPAFREHPRAARPILLLGGTKNLTLVSQQGEILAEAQFTVWPGRSYVFGQLLPGSCLHLETQEYGSVGDSYSLHALRNPGPVWEVESVVDQWLLPLTARQDLPTTGGIRRAIRLLPCDAKGNRPLAEGGR